jgi:integrase
MVRRIHAVMSGSLRSAVKAGLINRNVAAQPEIPKAERVKVRPPTPQEVGRFLDRLEDAGERLYPLIVVAGMTGLRRGELCALKWTDIDLDSGRLVVVRQRRSIGYRVDEHTPKTEAGEGRVIYLDAGTLDVLKQLRRTQATERLAFGEAYQPLGYVFCREDGEPLHPDAVTKRFERLAQAAGLSSAKLHNLRHFRAAALISTGADIAAVSKAMGHSSIGITSDIYGSLFEKANREMSEKAAGLVPRRRRTA